MGRAVEMWLVPIYVPGSGGRVLVRERAASDPVQLRASPAKHRHVRASLRGWHGVLRRDPCVFCGAPSAQVEHIVPLRDRGTDGADNLAGACERCNNHRRSRPLLHYLLALRSRDESGRATYWPEVV